MSTQIPGSKLTAARPDIWLRAVRLATGLTGYQYLPKLPNPDGTLWTCGGGGGPYIPSAPPTPERVRRDRHKRIIEINEEMGRLEKELERSKNGLLSWRQRLERQRRSLEEIKPEMPDYHEKSLEILDDIEKCHRQIPEWQGWQEKEENGLERLRKEKREIEDKLGCAPTVFVPEGDMEWLLHEVGHFLAAHPLARSERNYGIESRERHLSDDRELQAMAWEQAVLAPFGEARSFVPPLARYGVCFERQGPLPAEHLLHIERRLLEEGLSVEPWRIVWADWVKWGRSLGDKAPWKADK